MRKLPVMLLLLTITVSPLITLHAAEPMAAFTPGARILFQGDSITDGNRGRSADPNHILGHGYVFIIAAKYGAAFPDLKLDFLNRGVSGNTVLDLEKRWQKDALDLKPDLQPGLTKKELLKAMEGHVLAEGQLMGTYQRK